MIASIVLGILFVLIGMADVVTTRWALRSGASERNPVVRWTMEVLGQRWWVLKMFVHAAIAFALFVGPAPPGWVYFGLTIVLALYVLAIARNVKNTDFDEIFERSA